MAGVFLRAVGLVYFSLQQRWELSDSLVEGDFG